MAPDSSDLFIVDDDAMMRDALSVVFTLAGYRVSGFVDGETFLAVARTGRGSPGSAFARQIRFGGAQGAGCSQLPCANLHCDG